MPNAKLGGSVANKLYVYNYLGTFQLKLIGRFFIGDSIIC